MASAFYLANAFTESLEHIVGFVSVLVTLMILWMLTALIGRYFGYTAKRSAARTAAASGQSSAAPAPNPAESDVSDEEIAVVAAATFLMLGERHRIVSIQSASTSWGKEGRRQHFASHKLR